jgi:hypothetical protein
MQVEKMLGTVSTIHLFNSLREKLDTMEGCSNQMYQFISLQQLSFTLSSYHCRAWGLSKKGSMTENQDIGNGHIGIPINTKL